MKKLSILKTTILLIVLVFTQTTIFAAAPEVYASQAKLSNQTFEEIMKETWVWISLACVFVIAVSAYFATQTSEKHDSAAH